METGTALVIIIIIIVVVVVVVVIIIIIILTPECLCLTTVSNVVLFNERGNSMLARFLLRVTVSALLLLALNLTSQVSAYVLVCN